jgi:hypothetical protein
VVPPGTHTLKSIVLQIFGDLVVSGDLWEVRSSDVTLPSFFSSVGRTERKHYMNKPHTIQMLKENICQEIEATLWTCYSKYLPVYSAWMPDMTIFTNVRSFTGTDECTYYI